MTNSVTHEQAAAFLEQCEDYRVLRKLKPEDIRPTDLQGEHLLGVVIDIETTGLDVEVDEIIELAMVKFAFDRDGNFGGIVDRFQSFNEPANPISDTISSLTGITNQLVAGKKISQRAVNEFISDSVLIVAHNAPFDRPFCEQVVPTFSQYAWGCSATEIPWRQEGIVGSRLEYIAQSFRFFYDAHRATDDCHAVLKVLTLMLPKSGERSLSVLLTNARRTSSRVFAVGASYDHRIFLKQRGYQWNGALNGYPRAWWRDVDAPEIEQEVAVLRSLQESIEPQVFPMNARNRFRRLTT